MKYDKIFPCSLFLFVIAFTILSFVNGPASGIDEITNRERSLSLNNNYSFSNIKKVFENHSDNKIWYKEKLYAFLSNFELDYFKRSIKPDKIIKGKGDWFYLGNDFSEVIEETNGVRQLEESDIEKIKSNIGKLREIFKKEDIEFVVVVAPNKHTVYPENLPFDIDKSVSTKLDQLSNADIPGLIDLRKNLLENKNNARLFHKTNSHWNGFGGFYGYEQIVNYLNSNYDMQLDILSKNQVAYDTIYTQKEDLTKMIKVEFEEEKISSRVIESELYKLADVIYNEDYPNHKIRKFQAVFENENCSASCLNNVILIRDSFGAEFVNHLLYNTKRLNTLQSRHIDYKYIINNKPDLVIFEIVERRVEKLISYLNI